MALWVLLVAGVVLFLFGFALRRQGNGYSIHIGHRAWTLVGDIRQSGNMHTPTPSPPPPPQRDWVARACMIAGAICTVITTALKVAEAFKLVG